MQSVSTFRQPKYSSRGTTYFSAPRISLKFKTMKQNNYTPFNTCNFCKKEAYSFWKKDKKGASPVPVQTMISGMRAMSHEQCIGGGNRKRDGFFKNIWNFESFQPFSSKKRYVHTNVIDTHYLFHPKIPLSHLATNGTDFTVPIITCSIPILVLAISACPVISYWWKYLCGHSTWWFSVGNFCMTHCLQKVAHKNTYAHHPLVNAAYNFQNSKRFRYQKKHRQRNAKNDLKNKS